MKGHFNVEPGGALRIRRSEILQWILLAILLGLLALTVLDQANPGRKTPARDSGFYIYIGNEILHGKLPYRDAWESKPPAIFYLNAVGLWLGHGTRWGIWGLEILFLLTAAWVSFRLMKGLWGTWPALFGLLLWLYELDRTLMGGNLTEEYPLPLHFLAFLLFLKLIKDPRHRLFNFLLGTVFAAAFLFRPNNAVTEAAVALTLLIAQAIQRNHRTLLAQLLWIGFGALLPIAVTAFYFWSQGLWTDLLEASILYNLEYSGTQLTASSPLLIGFQILGAGLWIGLAGYLAALWRVWHPAPERFVYLLLLIGAPMVAFLSDPAKRNYVHYYMNWLPFLALLGALAFYMLQTKLFPRLEDSSGLRLLGLTLALALTLAFFFADGRSDDYQKVLERLKARESGGVEARSPISVYVNEHTQPGDLVLFWGAYPGENYMSGRESPSAVLFYPLFVKSEISRRLDDRFLSDLKEKRPVLVVDLGDVEALSLDPLERRKQLAAGLGWPYPPDNIDEVLAYIRENYSMAGKVKDKVIYRLKGAQ